VSLKVRKILVLKYCPESWKKFYYWATVP